MEKKFDVIQSSKIVLFGVGIFVIYKLLKKVGLINSGEDDKKEEADEEADKLYRLIEDKDFTKPFFWKKAPKGYVAQLFTQKATNSINSILYNSTGYFDDNEIQMEGAIKQITYKSQYSWLVYNFYLKYKLDLTSYLRGNYNENELYPVFKHLEELPAYKKK